MTYIMVAHHSPQALTEEVNAWIKKGFKPQGGIGCTANTLFQAMVNDKPKLVLSQEFMIVEKGIVPGETGPEYHCTYQYKGEEHSVNLGQGLRNYTDEELKVILLL